MKLKFFSLAERAKQTCFPYRINHRLHKSHLPFAILLIRREFTELCLKTDETPSLGSKYSKRMCDPMESEIFEVPVWGSSWGRQRKGTEMYWWSPSKMTPSPPQRTESLTLVSSGVRQHHICELKAYHGISGEHRRGFPSNAQVRPLFLKRLPPN